MCRCRLPPFVSRLPRRAAFRAMPSAMPPSPVCCRPCRRDCLRLRRLCLLRFRHRHPHRTLPAVARTYAAVDAPVPHPPPWSLPTIAAYAFAYTAASVSSVAAATVAVAPTAAAIAASVVAASATAASAVRGFPPSGDCIYPLAVRNAVYVCMCLVCISDCTLPVFCCHKEVIPHLPCTLVSYLPSNIQ